MGWGSHRWIAAIPPATRAPSPASATAAMRSPRVTLVSRPTGAAANGEFSAKVSPSPRERLNGSLRRKNSGLRHPVRRVRRPQSLRSRPWSGTPASKRARCSLPSRSGSARGSVSSPDSSGGAYPSTTRSSSTTATSVIVLRAENRSVRSVDTITFEDDDRGTVVVYDAELDAKGIGRLADPLLSMVFRRIGDRAAAGLRTRLSAVQA